MNNPTSPVVALNKPPKLPISLHKLDIIGILTPKIFKFAPTSINPVARGKTAPNTLANPAIANIDTPPNILAKR